MQPKDRQQRRARWSGPAVRKLSPVRRLWARWARWSESVKTRKDVSRAEGMEDFGESDALHALEDSSGTRPCAAVIHVTTSGMDLYFDIILAII
jgi:hypothetical protein